MKKTPQRGFTLLIAIILATVSLVVGLALADIAYKQIVLSSVAKSSQIAFYRADSAMECALYYDQQKAAFNEGSTHSLYYETTCEGRPIVPLTAGDFQDGLPGGGLKTTFRVSCEGGGYSAEVTVYKEGTGFCATTAGVNAKNCIYASGYNTCSPTAANRFERALKVFY